MQEGIRTVVNGGIDLFNEKRICDTSYGYKDENTSNSDVIASSNTFSGKEGSSNDCTFQPSYNSTDNTNSTFNCNSQQDLLFSSTAAESDNMINENEVIRLLKYDYSILERKYHDSLSTMSSMGNSIITLYQQNRSLTSKVLSVKDRFQCLSDKDFNENKDGIIRLLDDIISTPTLIKCVLENDSKQSKEYLDSLFQFPENPVEPIPDATNDYVVSLDTTVTSLENVVNDNELLVQMLNDLNMQDISNSPSDLITQLQVLNHNNDILTSVIEDNNNHIHEMSILLSRRNEEVYDLLLQLDAMKIDYKSSFGQPNDVKSEVQEKNDRLIAILSLMNKSLIINLNALQKEKNQIMLLVESMLLPDPSIEESDRSSSRNSNYKSLYERVKTLEVERDSLLSEVYQLREQNASEHVEMNCMRETLHQKEIELGEMHVQLNDTIVYDDKMRQATDEIVCQTDDIQPEYNNTANIPTCVECRSNIDEIRRLNDIIGEMRNKITELQHGIMIETPSGLISTSDPESILTLINGLTVRMTTAESLLASAKSERERECIEMNSICTSLNGKITGLKSDKGNKENMVKNGLANSVELQAENKMPVRNNSIKRSNYDEEEKELSEIIKLRESVSDKDRQISLIRTANERLKRNEIVYKKAITELKYFLRDREKELDELYKSLGNKRNKTSFTRF